VDRIDEVKARSPAHKPDAGNWVFTSSWLHALISVVREMILANVVLLVYRKAFRRPAMPILREWRAEIRRSMKDAYVDYVCSTGINGYRQTPGNLGAAVAVRDLDDTRSEIVTLSWWESLDAIRAFAGDPVDQARYYPEDGEYLLTRPETVLHYQSTQVMAPPAAA
jgi:heme-degrading monooxygenase HmoA